MPALGLAVAPGIAALVSLAVFVWALRRYRFELRRKALARFAVKEGLRFEPHDSIRLLEEPFGLFAREGGPIVENVLRGRWRRIPVVVADVSVRGGAGSARRRRLTVALVEAAPPGNGPARTLPDEWVLEVQRSKALLYGPLAHAEDMRLVFEMALSVAEGTPEERSPDPDA